MVIARDDAQSVRSRQTAWQVVHLEHQLSFQPNDLDAESCTLAIADAWCLVEHLAQHTHRTDVLRDQLENGEIGIPIIDQDVGVGE
ncbi:MAG: hypothetical protein ACHQ9S_26290 [Candidatus Binatia bacterium]